MGMLEPILVQHPDLDEIYQIFFLKCLQNVQTFRSKRETYPLAPALRLGAQ